MGRVASRQRRSGWQESQSRQTGHPARPAERARHTLAQRGHDVVVFHIFDRDEVEFPFERMTLFAGLEDMPELLVDPRSLRDAYLKEINTFQDTIRKGCLKNRIDYVKVVNSQDLDVVLSSYLAARAAQAKRGK
jgi:hypothetical protein